MQPDWRICSVRRLCKFSVISALFNQLQTFKYSGNCPLNMIYVFINRDVWGGIWEELVTKLVHRVLRGVRTSAINTPSSTRIASCALLHGAFIAMVWGLGRETPLKWEMIWYCMIFSEDPQLNPLLWKGHKKDQLLNERKTVMSHQSQLLQSLHIACVTPS